MATDSEITVDDHGSTNEVVAYAVALIRAASQAAEASNDAFRIVVSKVHEHDARP